ncbi:MAG: DUF5711 family protein [Clostridia bacterium]
MRSVKIKENIKNVDKTKKIFSKICDFKCHEFTVNILRILIVVAIVFMTFLLGLLINNFKKIGLVTWINSQKIIYDQYVDVTFSKYSVLEKYKKEVVLYDKGVLYTVNKKGEVTWKEKVNDLNSPIIKAKGDYFLLADTNTGNYFLYKNKKLKTTGKIDGEVKQIAINNKGKFALESSTNGYKTAIAIFNKKGIKEATYYLTADMITNLTISNDNSKLFFVSILTEGNNIKSTLNHINLNSDKINVENLFTRENEIIYSINISNNDIILTCENSLYKYNIRTKKNVELKQLTTEQITFVDSKSGYFTYVFKDKLNSEGKVDKMSIYSSLIKKSATTNIEITPKIVKMDEGIVAIVSEKEIIFYNYWGKKIKKWTSSAMISDITLFNDGNSAAIVIANKLHIISL